MIRIIQFGDLHNGAGGGPIDPKTGLSRRDQDHFDRMDEVILYGLEGNVALWLFTGDAYHSRRPSPTLQREFARRIRTMADHAPVVLLPGNHDMPGMAAQATTLDIFDLLYTRHVRVIRRPTGFALETNDGPVYVAGVPYPMRNRLLASMGDVPIDEQDARLRDHVAVMLRQLAEDAVGTKMPRILVGHFTVTEAKYSAERMALLGKDVVVDREALAYSEWDYVALGHVHKHQCVNPGDKPPIVYNGSLERVDFGEEDDPKGFVWIELDEEDTKWGFVPVNAREYITFRIELNEGHTDDWLQMVPPAIPDNATVRVIVSMDESDVVEIDERPFREAAPNSTFMFQREIRRTERARLAGEKIETLTERDLLRRYLAETGMPITEVEPLVDSGTDLIKEVNDDPD